jgi:cytochrome c oxidase assembly protein subunit 15
MVSDFEPWSCDDQGRCLKSDTIARRDMGRGWAVSCILLLRVTQTVHDPWRHRFAVLTALSTVGLIFAGGLVTSTGSGLSVPDWPLSYGKVMPEMKGGVFYEHGHRMIASFVGFLTLVLAIWTARREPRPGVRKLAWAALAAVIVQGVLGGLTVIYLLPIGVSVAHACLAQVFLCLTVALAFSTSREWIGAGEPSVDVAGVRKAASAAVGMIFVQLVLGALMRHMGAGMAIPDFPLAFGKVIPPFWNGNITVHWLHRIGALLVLAKILRLALKAHRSGDARFRLPALGLLGLVLVQITLGALTVLRGKPAGITTAHVATGAMLLAGTFFVFLRARLLLRPAAAAPVTSAAPSLVEAS